jgi:hypothetical protein
MRLDKLFLHFTFTSVLLSAPASAYDAALDTAVNTQPLFSIERSKNANTVLYEARLTDEGLLDVHRPVRAFWINWEKDSTGKDREDLNFFEKKMAFGFSVGREKSPHSCIVKLVCFPKRPIKISAIEGIARAETTISGKNAFLMKISVVTREKKLLPEVLSVTLYGKDIDSGEELAEEITPR